MLVFSVIFNIISTYIFIETACIAVILLIYVVRFLKNTTKILLQEKKLTLSYNTY